MRGYLEGIVVIICALAGVVAVMTLSSLLDDCDVHAAGDELAVIDGIRNFIPDVSDDVAATWAEAIVEAGRISELDPLLLTALIARESWFDETALGDEGRSRGAMQLGSAARRFAPRDENDRLCDTWGLECNVRTGALFLAFCRSHCGGSWDRWVGAYGMSRCPSEAEATELHSVRRARGFYERVGGQEWRSHDNEQVQQEHRGR